MSSGCNELGLSTNVANAHRVLSSVSMSRLPRLAVLAILLLRFESHLAGQQTQPASPARPCIGLALGGGSARGIAHIGVLQWLNEHRIPIDLVAGTSMGGLVGGAYATGMSPDEIHAMLRHADWDIMFLGDSPFRYKTFRRKQDARAYPARIEFGWKKGFRAPTGLEPGQQIDMLLARIALPYDGIASFDELPTPFRCVATDVIAAQVVVLSQGSLARAMRTTMAIPAVFSPVELDGRLLVDGGVLDNVPVGVARSMGADVVIAVDVGSRAKPSPGGESIFSLLSKTIDTMMTPPTRASLREANIVIRPDSDDIGAGDWRKSDESVCIGYEAAQRLAPVLEPLALDAAGYALYCENRAARRRLEMPAPRFVVVDGVPARDQQRIRDVLSDLLGHPLQMDRLTAALTLITGSDRYETVTPELITTSEGDGLLVHVTPKGYGPPFISMAFDLANTRSTEFAMTARAGATAYDVIGAGSECRVDVALGTGLSAALELYRPIGSSPWFLAPRTSAARTLVNGYLDDRFVAEYRMTRAGVGIDLGLNTSRQSELRIGYDVGSVRTSVRIGDPLLPQIRGGERFASLRWTYDGQTSPVVPTRGVLTRLTARRFFAAADASAGTGSGPVARNRFTSGEASISWFRRLGPRYRVFAQAAGGTSFGDEPLLPNDFTLGGTLRLGALDSDELRGSNYMLATAGLLRSVGRLPDFLGGNVFIGGWIENGTAFERLSQARFRTNATGLLILETLLGPVYAGGSLGFDGRHRLFVGIGPLFK